MCPTRNLQLTSLAVRHSLAPADVWDTIKVTRLRFPISWDEVATFTNTFLDDATYRTQILPPDISLSMIRLNTYLVWITEDLAHDCLSILSRIGDLMQLDQDFESVHYPLPSVEKRRIARAFCRLVIFQRLFPPCRRKEAYPQKDLQPAAAFLAKYNPDEVEEIACV